MIQRTNVTIPLVRYGFLAGLSALTVGIAQAQPVRGLYVSGAGGTSFNQTQTVNSHTTRFPQGSDQFNTGVTGLGSLGWGLDNGFRIEAEGNYRNNRYSGFHGASFPNHTGGRQQGYGMMANALFDMDIGKNWIYPYFGAGVGYGWQAMNATLRSTKSNYSQHIGGTRGNFAYQAMFGVSLPVPWVVGLSATMEYRFYSLVGPNRHYSQANGNINGIVTETINDGPRNTRTDFNHSFMLGLRYEFNPAPPPPAPTVTPVTAPASVRTYLVFFDWDSVTLSDRTRVIISAAAQNSTSAQFTRIEVNGHADSSGQQTKQGQAYNQTLSLRRAKAVKDELMRDGVASGLIDVQAYGATQPLVTTAPGLREQQNRRVEIELR